MAELTMQHELLPRVSKAVKNVPRLFPVKVGGGGKSSPFVSRRVLSLQKMKARNKNGLHS